MLQLPHAMSITLPQSESAHPSAQWKSLDLDCLKATDWSWKVKNKQMMPILTDKEPVLEQLLNVVRFSASYLHEIPAVVKHVVAETMG